MSLDRAGSLIYFECDGKRCPEVFETETYDFQDAKDRLGEAGWMTRHIGGTWQHFCPDCKEEFLSERKRQLEAQAKKFTGGSS